VESKTTLKKSWTGEEVQVLDGTYEEGKPDKINRWVDKVKSRKDILAYIETADRYWYAPEGFGSEKRKNPA